MAKEDCPTVTAQVNDNLDIDLQVIHRAKANPEKNFFMNIAGTHEQLNIAENTIRKTNPNLKNQNLIVVNFTFEISFLDIKTHQKRRTKVTFPLKVPGKNFYTFTDACTDVKQDQRLAENTDGESETFAIMKQYYNKGKNRLGNRLCGHTPFFGRIPGATQYTLHSEQAALYPYLSTRQGVRAIVNRLTSEIRALFPDIPFGTQIKIINLFLHVHSTKTPCGPCETATVGIQNSQHHAPTQRAGFLELLANELARRANNPSDPNTPPSALTYTYPGHKKPTAPLCKRGIGMFTTYTANESDADHRKTILGNTTQLNVKDNDNRKKIFVANYANKLTDDFLDENDSDLTQRTVFASGSEQSPPSKTSKSRIQKVKNEEDKTIETLQELFNQQMRLEL